MNVGLLRDQGSHKSYLVYLGRVTNNNLSITSVIYTLRLEKFESFGNIELSLFQIVYLSLSVQILRYPLSSTFLCWFNCLQCQIFLWRTFLFQIGNLHHYFLSAPGWIQIGLPGCGLAGWSEPHWLYLQPGRWCIPGGPQAGPLTGDH